MSWLDPNVLLDAGFQLSFGAMLGIVLISPHINTLLEQLRIPTYLRLAISASFGAQTVTLPLALLLTGRVSLVSSLATLCIDIALLPLMIAGLLTGVIGTFLPADSIYHRPCGLALRGLYDLVCEALGLDSTGIYSLNGVSVASVIIYYITLGSALWLARARMRGDLTWFATVDRRAVSLAFVALAAWATLIQLVLVR